MRRYLIIAAGLTLLGLVRADLLWLMLVFIAGNQAGYVNRWGWLFGKKPVSVQLLGPNKTWGAYYAGPLFAVPAVVVLSVCFPITATQFGVTSFFGAVGAGSIIGFGVVLGDHGNSLLKRWVFRIKPGDSWPTDRFDWALCGSLAAKLVLSGVTWSDVLLLVVIAVPIHYLGNKNAHERGWRETPH